jgi:hypothetical protein
MSHQTHGRSANRLIRVSHRKLITGHRWIAVLVTLCCLGVAGCAPRSQASPKTVDDHEQYENAVAAFRDGSTLETVKRAIATLNAGGTQAFPVLVAHLGDSRKAVDYFQTATGYGADAAIRPTVGDACFGILRRQVEGAWPKAYRDYYLLTPQKAAAWWEKRKAMSLHDLRLEAAQKSFDAARKDFERHKSRISKHAVDFLTAHLKEVQADR